MTSSKQARDEAFVLARTSGASDLDTIRRFVAACSPGIGRGVEGLKVAADQGSLLHNLPPG